MKKYLFLLLKVVITGGVLTLIIRNLNWSSFLEVFERVQWLPVVGGGFLLFGSQLLSAYRWKLLAEGLALRAGYPAMVRHLLSASFFGQFLPGGVGIDAMRIWFFSRRLGKGFVLKAGYSVVAERINSIFGMALVSATAGWVVVGPLPMGWPIGLSIFCGGSLFFWFLLPWGMRFIHGRWPKVAHYLSADLLIYWQWRGPWWPTVLLSVCMHLIHGSSGVMVGMAMGFSLPALFYVFMIPTIALVSSLPISIGGYGVREGMFILLLGAMGVQVEDALAFAILYMFTAIWTPLTGGAIYLLTRDRGEHLPLNMAATVEKQ